MHQIVRKIPRYLVAHVRQFGAKATVHDIACRVINKIVYFQILKAMTVRLEDVADPGLFDAPGFKGRFISEGELVKIASDRAYDLSVDFLHKALARGDRCYGLFDGSTPASYGWYSNLPTPIDEHCVLHFDRAYTYMYKGYTLPAYRGHRLHAVGMCQALRVCTEEGKRGLISYVLSNNFASLMSTARVGYKIFGHAYVFRIGSRSFIYTTEGCRDFRFRIDSSDLRNTFGWSKGMGHR